MKKIFLPCLWFVLSMKCLFAAQEDSSSEISGKKSLLQQRIEAISKPLQFLSEDSSTVSGLLTEPTRIMGLLPKEIQTQETEIGLKAAETGIGLYQTAQEVGEKITQRNLGKMTAKLVLDGAYKDLNPWLASVGLDPDSLRDIAEAHPSAKDALNMMLNWKSEVKAHLMPKDTQKNHPALSTALDIGGELFLAQLVRDPRIVQLYKLAVNAGLNAEQYVIQFVKDHPVITGATILGATTFLAHRIWSHFPEQLQNELQKEFDLNEDQMQKVIAAFPDLKEISPLQRRLVALCVKNNIDISESEAFGSLMQIVKEKSINWHDVTSLEKIVKIFMPAQQKIMSLSNLLQDALRDEKFTEECSKQFVSSLQEVQESFKKQIASCKMNSVD